MAKQENISQETLLAQEKLWEILSAINREQITLSELQKNIKNLTEEESILLETVWQLKEDNKVASDRSIIINYNH